jgi:hypothetical protein
MPTNRRRRTRGHSGGPGVSDECLRFYRWDGLIPFADFPWARGKTDTEINRFFRDNREEIQRRYREKYGARLKWRPRLETRATEKVGGADHADQ